MKAKDKIITIDDVHQLVDAKSLDPGITPQDLFRQIDKVNADDSSEILKKMCIPALFSLASIVGMLFLKEASPWQRLSLIVFVLSAFVEIVILKKHRISWWWIPVLVVIVIYLALADTISLKQLMKFISELF